VYLPFLSLPLVSLVSLSLIRRSRPRNRCPQPPFVTLARSLPVVLSHPYLLPWTTLHSRSRYLSYNELMQRLPPGVFFNKLKSAAPIMISEAFDFPSVGTTPVPPPLIFPEQIQSLCTLSRRLCDIIEGQNTESHEESLKSVESLRPSNPRFIARTQVLDETAEALSPAGLT
jgi:hypothetical protein